MTGWWLLILFWISRDSAVHPHDYFPGWRLDVVKVIIFLPLIIPLVSLVLEVISCAKEYRIRKNRG
jgi:hypothetical protein